MNKLMRTNRASARRRATVLLGAGLLACQVVARANTTYTWSGGNSGTGYWDVASNWGGAQLNTSSPADLVFGSVNQFFPNQPYTEFNYNVSSITFNSSALAYAMGTSNNNTVAVGSGGITDSAASAESFTMGLILSTSQTWNVGNSLGSLTLNGGLTNTSSSTLTKTGSGTLNLALSGTSGISALALQAGTTQITSGTLTLNQSVNGTLNVTNSTLNLSGGAFVTAAANGLVSVIIDSASTVNVSGNTTLLGASGSGGEIDVARSTSGTLNVSNLGSVSSASYLVVGGFNSTNSGTLNISSGGTATVPYALIGFASGSTGTALVSGPGSILTASTNLEMSGNTIGGKYGGTSTLTISNGATVSAAVTTFYSNSSTINASGGTLSTAGLNSNASGNGALILNDPVSSGYALDLTGSSGNYTYSGSIAGSGTIYKTGGAVQNFKGTLNSAASVLVTGGTMNFALSGTHTISTLQIQAAVAQISSGTLSTSTGTTYGVFLTSGSTLNISSGAILNASSTSTDDMVVDGSSNVLVTDNGSQLNFPLANNRMEIGYTSTGSLNISNGASVTCLQPVVGRNTGSTGNLTVTGNGSVLNSTGTMIVSGFNGTTGGNANVLVSDFGVINAKSIEFYFNLGSINVSGGTLNTGNLISWSTGYGSVALTDPSGGYALNINASAGSQTYSGSISGTGSINKTGASTQILAGADTFTGSVLVSGGELDFNATNTFTALNISSGAVARFNSGGTLPAATPIHLDGGTYIYGGSTNSLSNAISLNANGGTIGVTNAATTLTETTALTGTGPLTVTGPGTLSLAHPSNSYTSLNISNGTLATVNLPPISSLNLDGGTLAYSGPSTTLASPINTTANGGTFNIFPSSTTLTTTGAFNVSNATLTKAGTGTLDLALPGSYSVLALSLQGGTTQVSSGTLTATSSVTSPVIEVGNGSALVVSSGATVYSTTVLSVNVQIDGNSSATVTGNNSLLRGNNLIFVGYTTPGTLTVSTGGSVTSEDYLEVGGPSSGGSSGGTGTMMINSGGNVTGQVVDLGYVSGSTSNATVTGSGSTLNATYLLQLGAGSAVLNVSSSGTVNTPATAFRSNTSTINISGGTLNTGYLSSNSTGYGAIILNNSAGAYALNINDPSTDDSNTFSGIISGTGSLNKSGGSTQTLSGNNTFTGQVLVTDGTLILNGTNQFPTANVSGGTLSLGSSGKLASGANVIVYTGGTFTPSSSTTAIGALNLSRGTLLVTQPNTSYSLNQIVTGTSGGIITDTSGGFTTLNLVNSGAGITVAGNSTWTTADGVINNGGSGSIPIKVASGVTLTNAFGLTGFNGFSIIGGGTLYENANPHQYIGAPITVTQGIFRVTDASSVDGAGASVGNLGDGFFILDGGTLSYGGVTASTIKIINTTGNGGTIQVESASATLTIGVNSATTANLIKTGPGTLITSPFTASNLVINNGTLGLSQSAYILSVSTLTVGAFTTLDLGSDAADISAGNLTSLNLLVQQGYNGGRWNGSGITSTTAAGDNKHLTAVGVIQNNQSGTAMYNASHQFLNTSPGTADILAAYTYYGDTNLSGTVDGSDYSRIDGAYLADKTNSNAFTGWFNGDFNYDSVINGSDYTLIDNAFNSQTAVLSDQLATPTAQLAAATGTAAVPEPATLGIMILASTGLLRRRRRV